MNYFLQLLTALFFFSNPLAVANEFSDEIVSANEKIKIIKIIDELNSSYINNNNDFKNIGFYKPISLVQGRFSKYPALLFLDVYIDKGDYFINIAIHKKVPVKRQLLIKSLQLAVAGKPLNLFSYAGTKFIKGENIAYKVFKVNIALVEKMLLADKVVMNIATNQGVMRAYFSESCSDVNYEENEHYKTNGYYIAVSDIKSFCDKLKYSLYYNYFIDKKFKYK